MLVSFTKRCLHLQVHINERLREGAEATKPRTPHEAIVNHSFSKPSPPLLLLYKWTIFLNVLERTQVKGPGVTKLYGFLPGETLEPCSHPRKGGQSWCLDIMASWLERALRTPYIPSIYTPFQWFAREGMRQQRKQGTTPTQQQQ